MAERNIWEADDVDAVKPSRPGYIQSPDRMTGMVQIY